jgi:hypothetical protein
MITQIRVFCRTYVTISGEYLSNDTVDSLLSLLIVLQPTTFSIME